MLGRIAILSVCLLMGAAYIASASRTEDVPPRTSLHAFPFEIGSWKGQTLPDFEPEVLAVLGVDEYLNRAYAADQGGYVGLYMGYYGSQRQGDTIHSPLNCLPGAGWQPVSHSYLTIPVRESPAVSVNRYLVQKGAERMVVLYWYQSHGRIVPNEYWSRLFMVYDAIRLNRTDAALVRVMSPVLGDDAEADAAAGARAEAFVKTMFPLLDRYFPS